MSEGGGNQAMPMITFGRFNAGLDVRKNASASDANRLMALNNAYINAGMTITKRPGRVNFPALPDNCKGLFYFRGYLRTFSHEASARDNLPACDVPIICHIIPNNFDNTVPLKKVHQAIMFEGKMYVVAEYKNGNILHHYISSQDQVEAKTHVQFAKVHVPTVSANGFTMQEPTAPVKPILDFEIDRLSRDEKYNVAFPIFKQKMMAIRAHIPQRDDGGA